MQLDKIDAADRIKKKNIQDRIKSNVKSEPNLARVEEMKIKLHKKFDDIPSVLETRVEQKLIYKRA